MKKDLKIYLASQSARRKDILKAMKLSFKVIPSTYQERAQPSMKPEELVMKHAKGKARRAVAPKKARLILGADTVVVFRGKPIGKPKSSKAAIRTLMKLQGRSHFVYTGLAFYDIQENKMWTGLSKTKVFFKKLTPQQIDKYLRVVNPLDKAGSYAIQEGPKVVARIEGSYSNVVGLPRDLVRRIYKTVCSEQEG